MKRFAALTLCICLVLSLCIPTDATGAKQHDYSTQANSGIRHEICTTLLGTTADLYYTGSYTYRELSELNGDQLLEALRALMTDTHTTTSTYAQCRDLAVLTDCENGDGTTISLLYTGYSATWADWCNNRSKGWNREHVWPLSLGGFSTSDTPGCDLHHIRPADQPVNSARANLLYGEVSDGKDAVSAAYTGSLVGGTYNSTYFEPADDVKGDVARICLYVYVRYGGTWPECSDLTNVFQSIDLLLEWCALDPVDTWEMGRNEVVAAIQGNRNVFIDYPELAWLLFDREIPTDMTTPSGMAASATACTHSTTAVRNQAAATCTSTGYTGDTYCVDCGTLLSSGSTLAALGHSNTDGDDLCDRCGATVECGHGETELRDVLAATCGTDGFTGDRYCLHCGALLELGETIPATEAHSFGDWTVITEATAQEPGVQQRECTLCGTQEQAQIPATGPEPTDPEPTGTTPVTEPADTATAPTTEPTTPAASTAVDSADGAGSSDGTGNSSNSQWPIYVFIGVGGISCIGILLVIFKRK